MTDDYDYRKDIPIFSDSTANNPPPKNKTWVFICYGDTDMQVSEKQAEEILNSISTRIKSRHTGERFGGYGMFLGDGCYSEPTYQCLICYSSDMYVNYKANRIACNSCGKIWTVKEWMADLDHLILETHPEAKDLIDEINKVTNK